MDPEIPYGYCHCGCGEKTDICPMTNNARGNVKGEPSRFIQGHNRFTSRKRWEEEDRGYDTPCWIWKGKLQPTGYAQTYDAETGRYPLAHRWVYEKERGPIPAGLELDHLCEVPACVNPDHLEPVTSAENTRRSRAAKLTIEQVAEIKSLDGTLDQIAERFPVDRSTIAKIRRGERWIDVQPA
jgi:hypothetical protein